MKTKVGFLALISLVTSLQAGPTNNVSTTTGSNVATTNTFRIPTVTRETKYEWVSMTPIALAERRLVIGWQFGLKKK